MDKVDVAVECSLFVHLIRSTITRLMPSTRIPDMTVDDDYPIVDSPLSGKFTKDDITVDVQIYRGEEEEKWILEVVDEENGSTVWDDPFDTDTAAMDEFKRTAEVEGIKSLVVSEVRKLN